MFAEYKINPSATSTTNTTAFVPLHASDPYLIYSVQVYDVQPQMGSISVIADGSFTPVSATYGHLQPIETDFVCSYIA